MTNQKFKNELNSIIDIERQIKVLQTALEAKKELVKNELADREIDTFEIDGITVSYKECVTNRFDSKTFKSDNPKLYEQYQVASTSKRFLVR